MVVLFDNCMRFLKPHSHLASSVLGRERVGSWWLPPYETLAGANPSEPTQNPFFLLAEEEPQ